VLEKTLELSVDYMMRYSLNVEFQSKMNTIGVMFWAAWNKAIICPKKIFKGLVVGKSGSIFLLAPIFRYVYIYIYIYWGLIMAL